MIVLWSHSFIMIHDDDNSPICEIVYMSALLVYMIIIKTAALCRLGLPSRSKRYTVTYTYKTKFDEII